MAEIDRLGLHRTPVYDEFWKFAAKRHAVFLARQERKNSEPVSDPILKTYRFTNAYRAVDRVSQYLIANVHRGTPDADSRRNTVFRTLLFKMFNKIETWESLDAALGDPDVRTFDFAGAITHLETLRAKGTSVYSGAYIMPSPRMGQTSKAANHLVLLRHIVNSDIMDELEIAGSLKVCFESLLDVPSFGPFLAFQYSVDLAYSDAFALSESDFVVAGPGALDGLSKSFRSLNGHTAERVIRAVTDDQEREFDRLGISFPGLMGRALQPIDCQNLFCEVSKYSRISHPHMIGVSGRTRIKQNYRPSTRPLPELVLPRHWATTPLLGSIEPLVAAE